MAVLHSSSSAEVKITMKNGRTVFADSCREVNERLVCSMETGTFEIEMSDVGTLKESAVERQKRASGTEEGEGVSGEKQVSGEKNSGQAENDSNNAGPKKRLEEVNQRKRELISVRESMVQEREALNKEFKSKGDLLILQDFDSYQKRFNEIDKRINGFNEEVDSLNKEEQAISQENIRNSENVK